MTDIAISECSKRNLKYINITTDDYDMTDICEDNNKYDVIINKFKIVEGIDIRRAHVIWLENEPSNPKTTIQLIGRCRRNALLYRNDIDIFKSSNEKLLENTRCCYAYYNVQGMKIDSDEYGNLVSAFCDIISCQKIKVGSVITVKNGKMANGLTISELRGESGEYEVKRDEKTGFNIVCPMGKYYKKRVQNQEFKLHYSRPDYNSPWRGLGMINEEVNLASFSGIEMRAERKGWSSQIDLGKYAVFAEKGKELKTYIELSQFTTVLNNNGYKPYKIISNDREMAILGGEVYYYSKGHNSWCEMGNITSLINKHNKFNSFIEKKYKKELEHSQKYVYNGKNEFNFDKKCNSCLGYCVEYYGKFLVYGRQYLSDYIEQAEKESGVKKVDNGVLVRACMLKYRDNMIRCYGRAVEKHIKGISTSQLIREEYKSFLDTVVKMGERTAKFVKANLVINKNIIDEVNNKIYINQIDPCLKTEHFRGLCDYIDEHTIIDIKATSNITLSYIKQVLAYHYLSTKRSDLDIREVIVYDAVKDKCIRIPISGKNRSQ